jgi:hypothetical protein
LHRGFAQPDELLLDDELLVDVELTFCGHTQDMSGWQVPPAANPQRLRHVPKQLASLVHIAAAPGTTHGGAPDDDDALDDDVLDDDVLDDDALDELADELTLDVVLLAEVVLLADEAALVEVEPFVVEPPPAAHDELLADAVAPPPVPATG